MNPQAGVNLVLNFTNSVVFKVAPVSCAYQQSYSSIPNPQRAASCGEELVAEGPSASVQFGHQAAFLMVF